MTCELCQDSGWVKGEKGVRRCECRTASARQQLLDAAGVPRRYQRKTFDEYGAGVGRSAAEALVICRRFVEEWPTQRHQGLTLTGPVGVGKTHLACCCLIEVSARWSASIAFVDLPELFTRIKATFTQGWNKNEYEILRPVLDADLLAIDELAAARESDWSFAMTEHIINTRYNADKSTILTTNYANRPLGWTGKAEKPVLVDMSENGGGMFKQHAAALSPAMRRETLGDRIGARMFSRVQEMTIVIEMDGEDQRAAAGRRRR